MDIQRIKKNFREMRGRTAGATNEKLARIMGVSGRTVRRYFDLNDPTMPDVIGMARAAQYFGVSLDEMLLPDENLAGMPRNNESLAFGSAVFTHVAIIWLSQEMDIRYVTPAYAELYGAEAEKMIGTNLLADWGGYATDHYAWMPAAEGEYRTSIFETLTALARDTGVGTQVCWFLSPCGNLRPVLLRVFYMKDGTFLCINAPLDDASDPMYKLKGVKHNGNFCIKIGDRLRTVEHYTALHKFMSGWDQGRIAEHLGWEPGAVTRCLSDFSDDLRAEDLDQMREILWEWTAEGKIWDPYATIRANGVALK